MNRLFACLGRFAVIVFGFFCASLAASAFLHRLVSGVVGLTGEEVTALMSGPALVSVPLVALFVGYFAFVPALPFMAAAEVLGRRDWLFHALCGGGVSLVIVGLHFVVDDGGRPVGPFLASLFVGTGLVGGIAYWAVAGRNAGLLLYGPDGATGPERTGS